MTHQGVPLIQPAPDAALETLQACRALVLRRRALERRRESSYERATSCTTRLKPVVSYGSRASFDRLAEDVLSGLDASAALLAAEEEIRAAIAAAERLVRSLPDRRQRRALRLYYVGGMSWAAVARRLETSKTGAFRLHAEALAFLRRPAAL